MTMDRRCLCVLLALVGLTAASCADTIGGDSGEQPTPEVEGPDAADSSDAGSDASSTPGDMSSTPDTADESESSDAGREDGASSGDGGGDTSGGGDATGEVPADPCDCPDGRVCIAGVCRLDAHQAWSTWTDTVVTDADGEVTLDIDIDGARSFLVTATPRNDALMSALALEDPLGITLFRWQDWYSAPRRLTKAVFAGEHTVVFNWPIRAEDPELETGRYQLRIGTYAGNGVTPWPNTTVDVTVMSASDDDPEHGLVNVLVVYAEGLDDDPDLVTATEAAVERWREVWAGADVELSVRYAPSGIDPVLPVQASAEDARLDEARRLAHDDEVVVIIGDIVEDYAGTYGISGQIPGPLVPTELTGVVIGWLACSGRDGEFSDDDVLVYGEVLAHEVGHYLGLFHPVNTTYDVWDALADTVECTTQGSCEAALGLNMMFPYSICDEDGCLHATDITDSQRGTMQHYAGTL